jgi:flavin-dependent dehydrogenase
LTKGHPLPFYFPGRRQQSGRVLLVGDAAGCVDPLTGEGILPAVQSALIAARSVEEFLRYDLPLESYTERLSAEVLRDFGYAERWADLFFSHPLVGYVAGIASRRMNHLLMNVLMGEGTYEEAYLTLRPTLTGRLGRMVINWSHALRQLSAPLRAS